MLAVEALGDHSYGNNVRNLIINACGRYESMHGGIYVYLHRLEELGYLQAWIGELAPRKFYSLTPRGHMELTRTLDELKDLANTGKAVLRTKGKRCYKKSRPSLSLVSEPLSA